MFKYLKRVNINNKSNLIMDDKFYHAWLYNLWSKEQEVENNIYKFYHIFFFFFLKFQWEIGNYNL